MRILSYNLNGIRSALSKGFADWLTTNAPDVLCLQELKAQPEQISNQLFENMGYKFYCLCAEKKGYSGVGILSKHEPDNVVLGMNNPLYDGEGRVIRADYGDVTLINVYIPSGTTGEIRQDFKMKFLSDFNGFISNLREERPNIIISGDFNIAHKPIDINNPQRQIGVSGFLPEEREWLDQFESSGFVDTFRVFDQAAERYSWWSFRAGSRARNVGWRIDYHWATEPMRNRLQSAAILTDVAHSDHCPVEVTLI